MKAANPTTPPSPAAKPEIDAAFQAALTREGIARARQFFAGVRAYRAHPARRNAVPAPILWQEGSTSLRDYGATAEAPVVLVIPSLINRIDILDLLPEQSFLRSLTQQGWRPLAVDWGVPGDAEAGFAIDAYMRRLLAILTRAVALSEGRSVHVVGYCMGGLLALALAALRPGSIRSLSLLAVPWDFHTDEKDAVLFDAMAASLEPLIASTGQLPVDAIQTLFAAFQPLHTLKKFVTFAALDPASDAARRFTLLEDWLNDGVPLTAGVARDCLQGWYAGNRTGRGKWSVLGAKIDPAKLKMPAYITIPARDRIVPPESSRALARLMPHAVIAEPATGHIGLMASRNAPQEIWQPWFDWLGGI